MSIHVPPRMLRAATRPIGQLITPRMPVRYSRRLGELMTAWPGAPEGLTIDTTDLGGVPADVLTPTHTDARALLYLHGGGYVLGSPSTHRALAGRLALAMNAVAYVPDYRLAPEHRFPAAFDDSLAAYEALLAAGWRGDQIFVAGDSAGGGLSLAIGVASVQRGLALPAAIGLMCPAVDVTAEALARVPRDRREPLLTAALLEWCCEVYVDDADRAHPGASPLLADLAGLPPLVIDAAEYDTLFEQSRRLADKARQAGVTVRYRVHPKMAHGFHAFAGVVRQADRAVDDVARDLLISSSEAAEQRAARPRVLRGTRQIRRSTNSVGQQLNDTTGIDR